MRLLSNIDRSKNYITVSGNGFFESRYVNRGNGYFICYLSSHNGCNQGCKFCHLTSTKQLYFNQATVDDYIKQVERVFNDKENVIERKVHFNFMARGEPLLNKYLISGKVISKIEELFIKNDIESEYLISTIFPKSSKVDRVSEWFSLKMPIIYFSYYSSNPKFREKWLPNASPEYVGINRINQYYKDTDIKSRIHFALIDGQNDDDKEIDKLSEYIDGMDYTPYINIVRYNSNCDEYKESNRIEEYSEKINQRFGNIVKVIPRVGFDVKASCGMFVDKNVLPVNM